MRWDEFYSYELIPLGENSILLGNVVIALAIALGVWVFVKMLRRTILRKDNFVADRINRKRRVSIFILAKYFTWVIAIIVILEVIGIPVTFFMVGSTALVVILGLGLQNIFKDLISGIFMLFEGSVKIGDIVEADGVIGKVIDLNLRSTQILTRDDVVMNIPNSSFVMEKTVNMSQRDEHSRFTVNVGVAYGSDVEEVIDSLKSAMKKVKDIPQDPEPFVRFSDFGDSALKFELVFWSKDVFRIETIKSDLRRMVYQELEKKNLSIPFPQREIHLRGVKDFDNLQKNVL